MRALSKNSSLVKFSLLDKTYGLSKKVEKEYEGKINFFHVSAATKGK